MIQCCKSHNLSFDLLTYLLTHTFLPGLPDDFPLLKQIVCRPLPEQQRDILVSSSLGQIRRRLPIPVGPLGICPGSVLFKGVSTGLSYGEAAQVNS